MFTGRIKALKGTGIARRPQRWALYLCDGCGKKLWETWAKHNQIMKGEHCKLHFCSRSCDRHHRTGERHPSFGKPKQTKTERLAYIANWQKEHPENVRASQRRSLEQEPCVLMSKIFDIAAPDSTTPLKTAQEMFENRPNKLKIFYSPKMKFYQLEKWLAEQSYRPDVVILDGDLDMDFPWPEFPKKMGFSTIAAARLKRTAMERLGKHLGFTVPHLDMDDIHGTIRCADNVFILYCDHNRSVTCMFTVKAKNGKNVMDVLD